MGLHCAVKDSAHHFTEASFEWSLKPYIIWMKILPGIPLNCKRNKSTSFWFFLIYSSVLLLAHLANNCRHFSGYIHAAYSLMPLTNGTDDDRPQLFQVKNFANATSTRKLSMTIEMVNRVVYSFAVHLCFFVLFVTKLPRLWDTLLQVQRQVKLPVHSYRHFRKIVYLGIVLFLLVYYFRDFIFKNNLIGYIY